VKGDIGMIVRNIDQARLEPVEMEGASGVSMAIMVGRAEGAPNFAMRQFRVEPGGNTPRHSHDYEHEVFIVGGAGTVLLGGEERELRLGDVVYVPAESEHQFRAGDAGLRFLCLSPVSRQCGEPTPGT
jgi:quercetin dioxygenase-like cupin family protein